jgi:Lon protease-like protein
MRDEPEERHDLGAVPLFPLPNVVLFPRAILPLHIFEERYKEMTADALNGDRRIAMALLRPGWEKSYYGHPRIEPVVCVGKILSHEKLPDGKYNFLLQGDLRARIAGEHGDRTYRLARLEPLCQTSIIEIDLADERLRLDGIFAEEMFTSLPGLRQFQKLLSSPLPTADVADLLAFNLLDDVQLKQSLLADCDVRRRVNRTISAIQDLRPVLEAAVRRRCPGESLN